MFTIIRQRWEWSYFIVMYIYNVLYIYHMIYLSYVLYGIELFDRVPEVFVLLWFISTLLPAINDL